MDRSPEERWVVSQEQRNHYCFQERPRKNYNKEQTFSAATTQMACSGPKTEGGCLSPGQEATGFRVRPGLKVIQTIQAQCKVN